MGNTATKMMELSMSAAMGAGKELLDRYDEKLSLSSKESLRDIVSEADFAAEDRAIQIIRNGIPNARIISEEQGQTGNALADEYWVIDALDGSVNYVHQIPLFCVSIAYFERGEVVAGSVYAPLADDIYYAARGLGAYKNKSPLRIRDLPVEASLFAASFSGKAFDPDTRDDEFVAFGKVNDHSCGCLRTGSAALNLAYLAEGKLNGCWGKASKHWDIAAGLLLASEAGASVASYHATAGGNLLNYIAAPETNFSFLKKQVMRCFDARA